MNQLLPTQVFLIAMAGIAVILFLIAIWKTKRIDTPFFLVLAFGAGMGLTVAQVGGLTDAPTIELPKPMTDFQSGTARPDPTRPVTPPAPPQ